MNVHSVVTSLTESPGHLWRERVIYEKPHAEGASGNSRSRTASAA
jgi:hypothetical protein